MNDFLQIMNYFFLNSKIVEQSVTLGMCSILTQGFCHNITQYFISYKVLELDADTFSLEQIAEL